MLTTDILVVGAGPAGAAAAITARAAGREVVVVDRARFPRDKICGDGLTTLALRLCEQLGLERTAVPTWQVVDEALIRSPSGRVATFPLPQGQGAYAAVAARRDLDLALVERARSVGATVLDGAPVTTVTQTADQVDVQAGDTAVRARYVIAADGMWSPTRKLLGLTTPGYLGEWHAFRQYFHGAKSPASRSLHVWFEPDLLPGYAWAFPLAGSAVNIGFGVARGLPGPSGNALRQLWPDLLARPHIAAVIEGARPTAPHRAWPIPARVDRVSLAHGRVLFVGDAAAASDPMTGEGIGQALLTGVRAVEAIVEHGALAPELAAASYRAAVDDELFADHRIARQLSRVLRSDRGARAAVKVAAATPWTRRNFARWLFEDYPRAIALQPRHWGRGALSGPGAYRAAEISAGR